MFYIITKVMKTFSIQLVLIYICLSNANFNVEKNVNVQRQWPLLHFVAFFHVASPLSTGVDNEKEGVDNKKALELTNNSVFHRGRQ